MSLVFTAADHKYTWNGQPVPGVTTAMKDAGIGQDFGFVDPAVLAEASRLGVAVHAMVEKDVKEPVGIDEVEFDILDYYDTWLDFKLRSGFEPLLSEVKLYSKKYGYAGQLDLFGRMNGRFLLPDIKRVSAVSATAAIQTAAYKQLVIENYPEYQDMDRCVLHFKKGGGWQLVPHNDPSDFKVFLSCLTVHNFKRNAL